MAIGVNIQPSEQTVVRFVRRPDEPPSLVITDGSAAVWFCPHDSPAGSMLAAEFAERLVTSAGRWSAACRDLAAPARQGPYIPKDRADEV